MMYWVTGTATSPYTFYSWLNPGFGLNKIEIVLLHPDSANVITFTSSSSSNGASSTDLSTRVSSLESLTTSLLNAKVNISLGLLGGQDTSSVSSDYLETTRNAWFVPKTAPSCIVPPNGGGVYFITAQARVNTLDPADGFWMISIRRTRAGVITYLGDTMSDSTTGTAGTTKGDNSRTITASDRLLAGDLLQLAYYVYSSGQTQRMECALLLRLLDEM